MSLPGKARTRKPSIRFLLALAFLGAAPAHSMGAREEAKAQLPIAAQATISGTLGREDRAYHALPVSGGLRAANGKNTLQIDFRRNGVAVTSGPSRFALTLRASGYGDALSPVAPAAPRRTANRVEYRRGSLTEWYVNGPLGLEQGFTLESPPARPAVGPLTIALSFSGNLAAAVEGDGRGLLLAREEGGPPSLRYAGLSAFDAAGRELPARLELDSSTLLLRIDDREARYPIVVDPFLSKAILSPSDFNEIQACCSFGEAVAVNGETVVVGAPNFGSHLPGLAYVFVRPPAGWSGSLVESAKLIPSARETDDQFGYSVAIEGDTIVVGSRGKDLRLNADQGAAYVFTKPGGGWTGTLTENARLTASNGAAGDEFGSSTAMNGDTVVVGAPLDDREIVGFSIPDAGSAYVFVKPVGGWAGSLTETATLRPLVALSDLPGAQFGDAVAVSDAAVVVGAPNQVVGGDAEEGAVYVFAKPASGWAGILTQNAELNAFFGLPGDRFGQAVAISGQAVFGGAPGAGGDVGVVFVYVEPNGGWAGSPSPVAALVASGGNGDRFGAQISASGTRVVVAKELNGQSFYYFVKPRVGWTGVLTETEAVPVSDSSLRFIALSGNTLVAGSDGLDYAEVFVRTLKIEFFDIEALLQKVFKAGSTIPLAFQLVGEDGRPIPDAEAQALASACDVRVSFSGGDRVPGCARYDPEAKAFQFNIKTAKDLAPGRYTISVQALVGVGVVETESIEVRLR